MQDIYKNEGTGIESIRTGEFNIFTVQLRVPEIDGKEHPEIYAISFWRDLSEAENNEYPPCERQILVSEVTQSEPDKIDSLFAHSPFPLVGETLNISNAEIIGTKTITT